MIKQSGDALASGIIRPSVISMTLDVLRAEIKRGTWRVHLPGMRELCLLYQVSRPSLRQALNVLEQEGYIEIRHGKRTRVLHQPMPIRTRHGNSRVVALLGTRAPYRMMRRHWIMFHDLQNYLSPHGWRLTTHLNDKQLLHQPEQHLEQWVASHPARCWLLTGSTPAIQQWFVKRDLPCLVVGSCFDGISLPSFDRDYHAVGRHAAGLLLSRGFRRIIYMMPTTELAGDRDTSLGFKEFLGDSLKQGKVDLTWLHHADQPKDFTRQLEGLLPLPAERVALFIQNAPYLIAATVSLAQRGYQVPQDVSLLARDYSSSFAFMNLMPAHYAVDQSQYNKRLGGLVVKLSQNGILRKRPYLMIPQIVEGETLAPKYAPET